MKPRRSRRARRGSPPPAPAHPAELPAVFRDRMRELLGSETDEFLEALATPAAGLRVNTLRLPSARFEEIAPFELRPLPFPPDAFLVPDEARPGAHPYHAAGLYYLQDPGAMVVGALPSLPNQPRVLDLAAAPGGKATHLAARMGGGGILVANDVHTGRARELAGNLERCGVRNAVVTAESPERLAECWGGWFDVVLVDAPCSGESMFHKSEAARREWSPGAVLGCARRQTELLHHAVRLVRPGGLLLYSTCTFAPEENEAVLTALLGAGSGVEMESLPDIPGGAPGRPEWIAAETDPSIARALRLWPHRYPGAGHFVAALRRTSAAASALQGGSRPTRPGSGLPPPAGNSLRLMHDFMREQLPAVAPLEGEIVAQGEDLYLAPPDSPPLAGLRILRPGWWLGSARKGRFEPSHALAMGITAAAAEALVLEPSSPEVAAYLRGETLRRPGAAGWLVVTVDGYPLGWGKGTGGVIKNHYPKGLRRV